MFSLFSVINFAVFIGILYYFLKKPARHFWRKRRSEILDVVSAAEEAYNKALSSKALIDKRLKGIEGEIEGLRGQLLREGRYKKDRLIEAAHTLSGKMVRDARLVIEHEAKKTSLQLKGLAARKVVRLAEKRLIQIIGAKEKKRFLASAQREIETGI